MSEQQSTLSVFYTGWNDYQTLLNKALAPLSPEQLAVREEPIEPPFWPQRAAKKVVMSRARSSGSSLAAKCPPLCIGVH